MSLAELIRRGPSGLEERILVETDAFIMSSDMRRTLATCPDRPDWLMVDMTFVKLHKATLTRLHPGMKAIWNWLQTSACRYSFTSCPNLTIKSFNEMQHDSRGYLIALFDVTLKLIDLKIPFYWHEVEAGLSGDILPIQLLGDFLRLYTVLSSEELMTCESSLLRELEAIRTKSKLYTNTLIAKRV